MTSRNNQLNNQLNKLLVLASIFKTQSDDSTPLTLRAIQGALQKQGIAVSRKTLYSDIAKLTAFGMDIVSQKGRHATYHLASRTFELAEVKMLCDLVQTAKTLSKKKSTTLLCKLHTLVSEKEAAELGKTITLQESKTLNESIYYSVDTLHKAIAQNQKVQFQYLQWGLNHRLEPRHMGKLYKLSPFALVWANENYYLIAFDSEANKLKHYRVDKMHRVLCLSEPRDGESAFRELHLGKILSSTFGMHGGQSQVISLKITPKALPKFLDRFGSKLALSPCEGGFLTKIDVVPSPPFLAWLFAFGKEVKVLSPQSVVQGIQQHLHELVALYGANED